MSLFTKKKEVAMSKEKLSDNPVENAITTMNKMEEIERAVEGKTIESLSSNGFGTIIHFTDGTTFKSMNGKVSYDGVIDIDIKVNL